MSPNRYDIMTPVFQHESTAKTARDTLMLQGWECTELHQLSNEAWAFEAKRLKK